MRHDTTDSAIDPRAHSYRCRFKVPDGQQIAYNAGSETFEVDEEGTLDPNVDQAESRSSRAPTSSRWNSRSWSSSISCQK